MSSVCLRSCVTNRGVKYQWLVLLDWSGERLLDPVILIRVVTISIFFRVILVICCFRYESNSGGEREIQRTMLELLNQLDGFDSRGDVKVGFTVLILPPPPKASFVEMQDVLQ